MDNRLRRELDEYGNEIIVEEVNQVIDNNMEEEIIVEERSKLNKIKDCILSKPTLYFLMLSTTYGFLY